MTGSADLPRRSRSGVATRRPAVFTTTLFRYPGKGGWTFAPIPASHAPEPTHGWGRTPVSAVVDGHAWDTSVWRDKTGQTLLPVPAKARPGKGHGDRVRVSIRIANDRL